MGTNPVVLDHERLEVYRLALDAVVVADRLAVSFTGVRRHLGWQIHRAATSIVLNVAEGNGRFRPLDKAQFFVIATGSANECAAILDIADRLNVGDPELRAEMRTLLTSIIRMLIALARTSRSRA